MVELPPQEMALETAGNRKGLRRFSWDELVARLNAVRDLRTVLQQQRGAVGGSFDQETASQIARRGNYEHSVNLDDQNHDKDKGAISVLVVDKAAINDREPK
ncbi:MAG: hypothetical protein ACK5NN_04805 [Sphingomonadaceae bacterium]